MTKKPVIGEMDPDDIVDVIEEQLYAERKLKFYWNENKENKKPDWLPEGTNYEKSMTDWVNWHLDRAPFPDQEPNSPEVLVWLFEKDGPEVEAADRGDISLLKKKYPHLARFFRLAKRDHGKRRKSLRWDPNDRAKLAAIEVAEINQLWWKHYKKKVRREEPSAVKIAAGRWDVEVEDVVKWVKELKKRGP